MKILATHTDIFTYFSVLCVPDSDKAAEWSQEGAGAVEHLGEG